MSKVLGFYLWILLIPLSLPFFMAVYCEWIVGKPYYPQRPSALAFLATLLICAFLGFLFWLGGRKQTGQLYRREALLLVILFYFFTGIIGGLPFYLSGTLSNPMDAFFEAVSGITTTGSSVMTPKAYNAQGEEIPITKTIIAGNKKDYSFYGTISPIDDSGGILIGLNAVSPALIFWRSFMQWIGGAGIVMLFVAVLPLLGVGGKILYQSEVTGPTKDALVPRIKETANQLWKIYLILTILEVLLLFTTNAKISFFDALTITFSTLSTGGFTPNNGGIAALQNPATDWILIVFMLLGSISFSVYFFCMRGKFSRLKDPELWVFLVIIFGSAIFASLQLLFSSHASGLLSEDIRGAFFQVVSLQTTTGFTTANYDVWPFSIQVQLLISMFLGGMAGSTTGGIKIIRLQMFFRVMLNKVETIYSPDTVRSYSLGKGRFDENTGIVTLCFILIVVSLAILGTFLLVLDGVDPETGLAVISSVMNTTGVAFRVAGPDGTFAFLSNFGKMITSIWMIAGRIEYFTLLVILVPAFWKKT